MAMTYEIPCSGEKIPCACQKNSLLGGKKFPAPVPSQSRKLSKTIELTSFIRKIFPASREFRDLGRRPSTRLTER
jgi:hypothetical protein